MGMEPIPSSASVVVAIRIASSFIGFFFVVVAPWRFFLL